MMSYVVVFLGAGVGGTMRHAMNIWIARLAGTHFPLLPRQPTFDSFLGGHNRLVTGARDLDHRRTG